MDLGYAWAILGLYLGYTWALVASWMSLGRLRSSASVPLACFQRARIVPSCPDPPLNLKRRGVNSECERAKKKTRTDVSLTHTYDA